MTWEERSGWRDQAWSIFMRSRHKYPAGTGLRGIDVDWIEYCEECKRPVLVYELCSRTTRDGRKVWTATQRLAGAAGALAGLVEYQTIDERVVCLQATIAAVDADGVVRNTRLVVTWDDPPGRWHAWCHDSLLPWHRSHCGAIPEAA